MNNLDVIYKIVEKNNLGSLKSVEKLGIGFSRQVYNVNDNYIIKVSYNHDKLETIKREIVFYNNSNENFHPSLIAYDVSKNEFPCFYTIEEKMEGKNLFNVWGQLNQLERVNVLDNLLDIFKKLHKRGNVNNVNEILELFDMYLNRLDNILQKNQIDYLNNLKENLYFYFDDAKFGYIHGDIHFNNILYNKDEIKLIDFESYCYAPIDKEFDTINRMTRNPNGLIQKEVQPEVDEDDYKEILTYLEDNYEEISATPYFNERLLIYDIVNSLRWVYYYPQHQPYNEILFDKSKKLVKM